MTDNTERDAFQKNAVAAVLAAYDAGNDRCQAYAPTGSGKTAIAAQIWEQLPDGRIFVMVSPSRSVSQADQKFTFYYHGIGGASTAQTRHLEVSGNRSATTNPQKIRAFLADESTPRLIFTTDSSLPRVTEALQDLGMTADLFVVDEAHRNTAARDATALRAYWAEEAVTNMPALRRLYMTATPRVWKGGDFDGLLYSQDDEQHFGPVAFELTYDEAVQRGIVLPIVLYALQGQDAEIIERFQTDPNLGQIWAGETMTYREIAAHVAIWRARTDGLAEPGSETERYHPQRIMVTFNFRSEARGFVSRHARVMRELGINDDVGAWAILGKTPQHERDAIRAYAEELRYDNRDLGHAVIAQCGALTEGFDLPDLDMMLLVQPKRSTIAIQQLIGRAARMPRRSGKRHASIVTMDLINPDTGELDNPAVADIIRALMALSETFRNGLTSTGDYQKPEIREPGVRLIGMDGRPLPGSFMNTLRLAVVPGVSPIRRVIDHLREYVAENGHAKVPHRYTAPDGYTLGRAIAALRRGSAYKGVTQAEREEFDALGLWDVGKSERLTDAQIVQMREDYARGGIFVMALAEKYQVSNGFTSAVINGVKRRDAGGPIADARRRERLTDAQIVQMREDFASGKLNGKALAEKYQVDQGWASAVLHGKVRRDAGGPIAPGANTRLTITDAEVVQMREDFATGDFTIIALAGLYQMSTTSAERIIHGKTRRDAGGPIFMVDYTAITGKAFRQCELCGVIVHATNTVGICTTNPDCRRENQNRQRAARQRAEVNALLAKYGGAES